MPSKPPAQLADDLLRQLAAALRSVQLYAPDHPLVDRSITTLTDTLAMMHATAPSLAIGIVGEELVVADVPVPRAAESMGKLKQQLKELGIERIVIDQGVQPEELTRFVQTIGAPGATEASTGSLSELRHIRVGRLETGDTGKTAKADIAAYRRLYDDAVAVAEAVWDSAKLDGMPDPNAGRAVVDSLAQEVSQNRTALLALTALKDYDSYTFTLRTW